MGHLILLGDRGIVTGKVALACPYAIVTVLGTVARLVSLESETTAPPVGANVVRETVPVAVWLLEAALTWFGLKVTETTVCAPACREASRLSANSAKGATMDRSTECLNEPGAWKRVTMDILLLPEQHFNPWRERGRITPGAWSA